MPRGRGLITMHIPAHNPAAEEHAMTTPDIPHEDPRYLIDGEDNFPPDLPEVAYGDELEGGEDK